MDNLSFEKYDFDTSQRSVNVQDEFMNLTPSQVRDATDAGRSPMVTVCMNLTNDFNKATIIRSHSAFLGSEIFMVGKRRFDRRGTVGSHHYSHIYHSETLKPIIDALHSNGYTVFAVDNTPELNPEIVYDVEIPEKCAFVYGEESNGLDLEDAALCDDAVFIPQWGAAPRSLNVSVAAGIMMSEYSRRNR